MFYESLDAFLDIAEGGGHVGVGGGHLSLPGSPRALPAPYSDGSS